MRLKKGACVLAGLILFVLVFIAADRCRIGWAEVKSGGKYNKSISAGNEIGEIHSEVRIYPGSESVLNSGRSEGEGMAVYSNVESIAMNYSYYESMLISEGWKRAPAANHISSLMDMPVIIAEKRGEQLYLFFYEDSAGNTCTIIINGRDGNEAK